MKKTLIAIACSFVGLSFSTLAQSESEQPVTLPIKPISSEKITINSVDLQKKLEAQLKDKRQEQIKNSGSDVTVDPSHFLESTLTTEDQVHIASDGLSYNVEGKVVAQEEEEFDFLKSVKDQYAPQQHVNLLPGGNVLMPIAGGLGNMIKTNFQSVAVKTSSSDAVIDIEEGYIIVTPKSPQPIDLKIYEEGVLDTMVNITLVPFNVPPAMIDVEVKLNAKLADDIKSYRNALDSQIRIEEEEQVHSQDRYSSEYVQRIREILTPVAKGEIPKGFTMKAIQGHDGVSPCNYSIPHTTGQQLIGAREIIDVVFVKNNWNEVYPLQEEHCSGEGVIAVGIYENAILKPGQTAEIYIVRDKLFEDRKKQIRTRPRLNADMFQGAN